MKNVLYLSPTTLIGGAERSLLQILSALDKSKFCPIVLLPSKGPLYEELKKLGIEMIFAPKFTIEAHSLIELGIGLLWLHLIIKKHRIDLIHSNSKFASRLPILYAGYFGKKVVLHWRDFSLWPDEKKYIRKYQGNITFFAISKAVREFLIGNGVRPEKIKIIYDGADPSFYAVPSPRQKDKFTVAITGRIDNWKGHEYLIEAIGRLKGLPIELLVFGEFHTVNDPDYLVKLIDRIDKLGIIKQVKFIGFQKEPSLALAEVDLVCVPSVFEPFGLVAVEAMAASRPVIASNTGGLKDIIEDGVTGYLVEPENAGALAGKIEHLHKNPDLRKKMGSAGRFRAQQLFSISEQIKTIEERYDEIISNNPYK